MLKHLYHYITDIKLKYKIFGAFLGLTITLLGYIELISKTIIASDGTTLHFGKTALTIDVSGLFSFWPLLGICIPIFFFSWLVTQLVISPINEMQKEMAEVISGNLNVSISSHHKGEFGEMAELFNLMAKSLKATQEELHRSNQELEQFAAIVAHDLKEPLRKIMFYSILFQENACGDPLSKSRIQNIIDVSNRMTTLLNDLLEFSRVSQKKQECEQINTTQMVTLVTSDLHALIQRTGADIHIAPHLPTIEADPLQMRIVFQNLIANALKFHRPNIPPIITIEGQLRDSQHVEITISDNGIGFNTEDTLKIFMPFKRLGNAKDVEGTGLGLSTVKRILDRHHAKISVTSTPNTGSVFSLIFPISSIGDPPK